MAEPGETYVRYAVDVPESGYYTLAQLGVPDDAETIIIDGVIVYTAGRWLTTAGRWVDIDEEI